MGNDNSIKIPHHDNFRNRANSMNYISRQRNTPGEVNEWDLMLIFANSRGRCAYCGCFLNRHFWFDHIKPHRLPDATNTPDNLTVCCPNCNRSKSDKHPAKWAQEQFMKGVDTKLLRQILDEYSMELLVQLSLPENREAKAEVA